MNKNLKEKQKSSTEDINHSGFNLTKFAKREGMFLAIAVIAIMVVTLGSAFAIFTSMQRAERHNIIRAGVLEIAFEDTEEGMGNIINLNGAFPISDQEGLLLEPYTFRVTNTGSLTARYQIRLLDDEEMIREAEAWNNILPRENIKVSIDGSLPMLLSELETSGFMIYESLLPSGQSSVHSIRMWIDGDSGNEVLGTQFHGLIRIDGESFDGNMLVSREGPSESGHNDYFWEYKDRITSITINNTLNDRPVEAIKEWDVSIDQNHRVIAYIIENDQQSYSLFIEAPGKIYLSSGAHFFAGFTNLLTINNIHHLDTSLVNDFSHMFDGINLSSLDLTSFSIANNSHIIMNNMFANAPNLTEVRANPNRWLRSTSGVNANNMFFGSGLNQITFTIG